MKNNSLLTAAAASAVALALTANASAATYWLDNSVAASGDGLTKETAFKTWNEAWEALAALSKSAQAELNVVASETPYTLSATPTALKGDKTVSAIRGVNADGTDVEDPSSVVVDGQGAWQIAPLGSSPAYLTVSGISFRSGLGTGKSSGSNSLGGPAGLWGTSQSSNYNLISNCVFEGCSGGTALVLVGQSNRVENCVFRTNACEYASAIYLHQSGSNRYTNYLSNCTFEGNGNIANDSPAARCATVIEVSGCTFRANAASSFNGSALCLRGTSTYPAVVRDCVFECNTNYYNAAFQGGTAAVGESGKASLYGCRFVRNVSVAGCGAGFAAVSDGPFLLSDCTFEENEVAGAGGVAVTIYSGAKVDLSGCRIIKNSGGSIVYGGRTAGGVWTMRDCAVRSNECHSVLRSNSTSSSTGNPLITTNVVSDCIFDGNTFKNGGVAGFQLAVASFERCLFTGNEAQRPLIRCFGRLSATNCLFVANTVTGNDNSGGGSQIVQVHNLYADSLVNCTFVGNAGVRSTICSYETYTDDEIVNCLFSGNTVASGEPNYNAASCYSHCFTDFAINGAGSGMVGGAGADPGFADAANGDYTLKKNSVCRDAGDNSVWAGVADATDLAGNARLVGTVDLGCYEWFDTAQPTVLSFR